MVTLDGGGLSEAAGRDVSQDHYLPESGGRR